MQKPRSPLAALAAFSALASLALAAPARGEDPAGELSASLAHALASRRVPPETKVEVGWRTGLAYHEASLFGDGVGIWEGRRQFRISEESLLRILGLFAESTFESLPSQGPDEEEGGAAPKEPEQSMRVRWKLHLAIGGAAKTVVRTTHQPRVAEVERLGLAVVAICEEAARKGVEASDMPDALKKLQKGQLAPQALSLSFTTMDETADPSGARAGWRLHLRGLEAEAARLGPPGASGEHAIRLTAGEFHDLVAALRDARVDRFPQTLYSGRYEQLSLDALGHAKDLQARRFAGMTRESHPKEQKAYERLRKKLDELNARLAARG